MYMHSAFSGVMTALITPFNEDNSVDFKSFENLICAQKQAGINGVVILGTTGESPTLSERESESLVDMALDHAGSDFHVYVGTGTNDTASTIQKTHKYAKFASQSGKRPHGIMVVTPYYNKPTQDHMVLHYTEVCQKVSDEAVCLYNVPGRTGINMLPGTLVRICEKNPNVIAIKEAAGNLNAFTEMKNALLRANLKYVNVLSGDDATYGPSLLCGGGGVISVTSHIIPKALVQMYRAYENNDFNTVKKLHLNTYCINNGIFSCPNPVGVKYMLSKLNMCKNILRAPLYPANENEIKILDRIFEDLKLNDITVL